MTMATKKRGLGKGVNALFADHEPIEKPKPQPQPIPDGESVVELKMMDIEPNGTQPRKDFDEAALAELADLAQFPSYCPSWLFNYYFFKLCFSLSHL